MATPMSAATFLKILRAEGLEVVEVGNWETHNRDSKGPWGSVNGVVIHHTATSGTSASVAICRDGYASLPGPLCHGVIDKAGVVHLVGYGRTNHAGGGDGAVLTEVINESYGAAPSAPKHGNTDGIDGNRHFFGFECINKGDGRDSWPEAQLLAIEKVSAAICRHYDWSAKSVIGHKEWSDDKIDPRGFSMPSMRDRIANRLKGKDSGSSSPSKPPATSTSITPKSRETAATMLKQQAAALKSWPFIPEVERITGLPTGLLLAIGSRETNLTNKVGDGGHGHGVWQRDDRWWPIPVGYDTDVHRQAEDAATLLTANYNALKDWGAAVAAYNAGLTGVKDAIKAGKSPDSVTTGGDYAADVLGRQLHLHPAPAKPSTPPTPAPKFPGSDKFGPGKSNTYIEQLGKQLVKKGYGKHYRVGPSKSWGEADRLNVRAFQLAHSALKGDADGYPGPRTWSMLFS